MFEVGEVVSYGATGICTIEDIRLESLSRAGTRKQEYYILRPVATPTCTAYVPVGNEALTAKMRRIYTKEQIDAMVERLRTLCMEDTEIGSERVKALLHEIVPTYRDPETVNRTAYKAPEMQIVQ